MLALRRDIAMAMEEQEGPTHEGTIEAVTCFVNSLRLAGRHEAAAEVRASMEAAIAERGRLAPPPASRYRASLLTPEG